MMWRAVLLGAPLAGVLGEQDDPAAGGGAVSRIANRSMLGRAHFDVFNAFLAAAGFAEAATDSIGAFKRAWRELTVVRNRQGALLKVPLCACGRANECACVRASNC